MNVYIFTLNMSTDDYNIVGSIVFIAFIVFIVSLVLLPIDTLWVEEHVILV